MAIDTEKEIRAIGGNIVNFIKKGDPFSNKIMERISTNYTPVSLVRIINKNFMVLWSAITGVKNYTDKGLNNLSKKINNLSSDHKDLINIGNNTHDEIDAHIERHANTVFVSPTEPESPEINDIWIKI